MRWEDVFWMGICGLTSYVSHESGKKKAYSEIEEINKNNEIDFLKKELNKMKLKLEEKEYIENFLLEE